MNGNDELFKRLQDRVDDLTLEGLIQQAAIESLLEIAQLTCQEDSAKAEMAELFQRKKINYLDEMLILVENSDPALAAKFQKKIDDARPRLN